MFDRVEPNVVRKKMDVDDPVNIEIKRRILLYLPETIQLDSGPEVGLEGRIQDWQSQELPRVSITAHVLSTNDDDLQRVLGEVEGAMSVSDTEKYSIQAVSSDNYARLGNTTEIRYRGLVRRMICEIVKSGLVDTFYSAATLLEDGRKMYEWLEKNQIELGIIVEKLVENNSEKFKVTKRII